MLRHIPHALKVEALALTHLLPLLPLPTTFRLLVYRAPAGEPFMFSNSPNGLFPTTCTLSQIQDRLQSILGLLWCWFLLLSVASASTMTATCYNPLAIAEISLSWVWTCYFLIPVPSFRQEVCEEEQGSAATATAAIAIVRCMMVFFKVNCECACIVFVKASSMDSRMAYK